MAFILVLYDAKPYFVRTLFYCHDSFGKMENYGMVSKLLKDMMASLTWTLITDRIW